ncbi:MAG: glutamine synthetase III [Ruminococcus sp.]|nr:MULTISPECIES: glutamine synthetase III [Ruminococcus]MCI5599231.1 glutamine synthetase III [Ruminococcus sp.]MCI5616962.1 glutamine synthetase III [Ruminococcus sp.]MDD5890203.1 glutamine synthetase III [Ruminococcus sp.]MDD6530794.1 glutamine synthetase III [Ruminococcus sp.]MDY3662690.1 glutamine synthetase III [Ruminococcus bovis]
MVNVPEIFGSMVFNDATMKERLPKATYKALKKTIDLGEPLDISVANVVANAMKDWAVEKGCTHYTHWFQPMTGVTAEKHDSFIDPAGDGTAIMEFGGKELVKGEPDASSFPSGGIRATFEARGYTAWDPTSPAFIRDTTLYIPTAFCSYTGEALDKKTPLLRSMEVLSNAACRTLKLFGKDVKKVTSTVGPEQEYFLVDKEYFDQRKDLIFTGRTLFGAAAPKGQELDDHYFGALKTRVKDFMADLDVELWKLGITSKTRHNEVAPAQHEVAPIFGTTNIATDHNQLVMETLKKTAEKHGMVCLLHEKPFAGVNGSGKHNNWSMCTNEGENLISPGKNPINNTQFLFILAAIMKGVDEYADLLRISVASAGNDHRLGANEAPPAIVSMFLGDELEAVVKSIVEDKDYATPGKVPMHLGVDVLPEFKKDTTDRNRTSPFAFTGNRFEFRMLGSAVNIACPNIMINTIMAEELNQFCDEIEKADDKDKAIKELIKKTFTEHQRIIFNGDGYSDEWPVEAEKRGLPNYRSLPEALAHFDDQKNIDLFVKNNVHDEVEIKARKVITLEEYAKTINIEALTMLEMAKQDILPAVSAYVKELTDTALAKKALSDAIPTSVEEDLVTTLSNDLVSFVEKIDTLSEDVVKGNDIEDAQEKANYYHDVVFAAMNELRAVSDEMETITSSDYWPYPTYDELLFGV